MDKSQYCSGSQMRIADNYHPVSLLPECLEILEKLIFDDPLTFMEHNNLFNNNQAGLRPKDTCINQL